MSGGDIGLAFVGVIGHSGIPVPDTLPMCINSNWFPTEFILL